MQLTEEKLAEIEARHAATPGPWECHDDSSRPDIMCPSGVNSGYFGEGHLLAMDKYGDPWGQEFNNSADAEFIAHARQDIPALIASHRAMTARIEQLEVERDALAKFKAYVHGRLDGAGVPVDPDSSHKADGCRIGGRLDIVLGDRARIEQLEAFVCRVASDPHDCVSPGYKAEASALVQTGGKP